jgi:hypothetical protein
MTGFAETGELDFDPGFDLKPVRGLRQWTLKSPDFRGDPHDADLGTWPRAPLVGATGYAWPDSVLEAQCGNGRSHQVPTEADNGNRCGCGFWGYWGMMELANGGMFASSTSGLPVLGVIEGYGRVLLGEKGFRSQKAKIIALAPAFSVQAEVTPRFPGRTYQQTYDPYLDFAREHKSEEEEAQVKERAQQHADAWMAVIQDRLGQLYPGARVFATAAGLLASVKTEGKPQ